MCRAWSGGAKAGYPVLAGMIVVLADMFAGSQRMLYLLQCLLL